MKVRSTEIEIPVDNKKFAGTLSIPEDATGIVIFAHGSRSSRHSSRNRFVANALHEDGFATLLFDLLTLQEDQNNIVRFNISLLSERLIKVTSWFRSQPFFANLNLGYFGASTGAAAALTAAASLPCIVNAVVSRGGRPDLAANILTKIVAPTLLLVGSLDYEVVHLNEKAYALLGSPKEIQIIDGATHLFEEPGKLEEVAQHASRWFQKHLTKVFV